MVLYALRFRHLCDVVPVTTNVRFAVLPDILLVLYLQLISRQLIVMRTEDAYFLSVIEFVLGSHCAIDFSFRIFAERRICYHFLHKKCHVKPCNFHVVLLHQLQNHNKYRFVQGYDFRSHDPEEEHRNNEGDVWNSRVDTEEILAFKYGKSSKERMSE